MFVQTARDLSSDGSVLTLHDVAPSTLYFSVLKGPLRPHPVPVTLFIDPLGHPLTAMSAAGVHRRMRRGQRRRML